ncbi:Chagasin family peptidase inhibitor I42 [Poriferisphaera corsica]|uniref:Chagasin family peptidase inhibitor I42 n=1 Tax=Poriferisphaera corsica TaxID=2528020 RepID=A0A517YPH8_9BACT|nr:protease inhibitor I42 family protein [Poriferisphaera corsica]QDU32128.1 Chagasin family peptidase inhibitor I42 [Poriferisphaera corsica]
MLKGVILILVMTLLMLVGACSGDTRVDGKDHVDGEEAPRLFTVVRITEKDDGKTVTVWEGDEVVVELESNRTTGYMWMLPRGWSGDGVLEQEGLGEYEKDEREEGMVGTGGESVWRFKAKKSGEVRLVIDYRRPWERTRLGKSFRVDIEVREKDRERRKIDEVY